MLETCLNKGCSGEITGTANSGGVIFNQYGQLCPETVIPPGPPATVSAACCSCTFIETTFPAQLRQAAIRLTP